MVRCSLKPQNWCQDANTRCIGIHDINIYNGGFMSSWASFSKLSIGGELKETSFDEQIGSAHFTPGKHDNITITAIEPSEITSTKTGIKYPKIRVDLQREDGAKIRHDIFLLDKEGNMGYGLRNLLSGLTSDKLLLMQYGREVQKDLSTLAALVGMKVNLVVNAPTKGAEVVSVGGVIVARDIETQESYGEFASYKEAGDYLKENGIRRGYNEVDKYTSGADNTEALKKVVESVGKVSVPKVRRATL
jgi:hypothetical protein